MSSSGRGEDGVECGVERVERGFHDDGACGEGGVCASDEGWFSQELPRPRCCPGAMESTVMADLKVGMCEGEGENVNGVRVNEVKVGFAPQLSFMQLEFIAFSQRTNDPKYKEKAEKVIKGLYETFPEDGLLPIYINPLTGTKSSGVITFGAMGDR
ncbi:hypothetical protein JHK87_006892 [Glycine soja]|nr:hypothetical protein JHK87_006892 [Glycine soja]